MSFHPGAAALTLAAALVALAGGVAPARAQTAPAQPQESVRETVGAWQIRCVDGNTVCVMAQTGKGAQGNDVIDVRVRKLAGIKTPDGTVVPAAIQVAAPLGVLLPAGVRVQVDAKAPRAAPFEVCGPIGCVVRQPMTEEFLAELRAGTNAKVTVMTVQQQEVSVTLSLNGFTKAYNALQP